MKIMNDDQVFEKLVQSSRELDKRAFGMLAYGLYAADKRKRTKSNLKESNLSQEDLEKLFYETLTEDDLEEYREKAQQLIDKYLKFYIESLDLTTLGLERIRRDIEDINKKIVTQFWLPNTLITCERLLVTGYCLLL
jgi:hypothetical protein